MNSFPGSESEFCKDLFNQSKTSLYELADSLEIRSISQNFFTERVFLTLWKIEVNLISFVSQEVRVQGKQPYLSLCS